jgi:hypothetical protein
VTTICLLLNEKSGEKIIFYLLKFDCMKIVFLILRSWLDYRISIPDRDKIILLATISRQVLWTTFRLVERVRGFISLGISDRSIKLTRPVYSSI